MNISAFSIRHPVATILMSLSLLAAGLFSYKFLPLAALPDTDFPVINVSAQLPGASPQTMATSVASPLIAEFATISGIDTITASSTLGNTSVAIQFDLNRNIDAAAADVQSAIARATRNLPDELTTPPSYRKTNPADSPILLLTLRSDSVPLFQLNDFVQQFVAPTLATVKGVAQVRIFGQQKYAVRIQIDPNALAARKIGIDQLQAAISGANNNAPVGVLQNKKQQMTIDAPTQLTNAAQFKNVIISNQGIRTVRLGDVAKVIDSVEDLRTAGWYDGARALIIAVQRQPDANTVDVVDRVQARLVTLRERLPAGAQLLTVNDRSLSIRESIHDVNFTLILTIILVILVIFLFLRKVTATLIPALAVPISILGTMGIMYLFGFTINNISLLAITLSVGLVVDDAIVMLENIARLMEEEGLDAYNAALKGSREIGFTIMSISLSLVAVFIPVLLMGGIIGKLFFEFAIVVTSAILVSAFVSLTLTPMLCSRILPKPPAEHERPRGLISLFEQAFSATLRGYDFLLRGCLRFRFFTMLLFLGTIAGSVWLFIIIPKGFFPREDIGQLRVLTEARQDISFSAMTKLQNQAAAVFLKSPHVAHVVSSLGTSSFQNSSANQGRMFVELKPLDKRPPLGKVLGDLRRDLARVAGISVFMIPTQNINFGARGAKSQFQFVTQAIDLNELYEWSTKITDAMRKDRTFNDVTSDLQNNALQASLIIDRGKAATLGISAAALRSTLYSGFGVRQVSSIYTTADSYKVIIEFDPKTDWSTANLGEIFVRSSSGALVPLSSFARITRTAGVLSVNQLGQTPAVTTFFNLPEGVSLGQAISKIERIKSQLNVPDQVTTGFDGTAKTFQQSQQNQSLLLFAAIMTIYILLGILYESFIHPLTILTGLPAAALGALAALKWLDIELTVIAVIGLLMLIGIVKKNAIMMIDVAITLQRQGLSAHDAIYKACLMRFRPIMMTTLAAFMGALPIALGAGASAEIRQPLGVAVVGGLIVSQSLTLFITPVIFIYMEKMSVFLKRMMGSVGATPIEAVATSK